MFIGDWTSYVCSSDIEVQAPVAGIDHVFHPAHIDVGGPHDALHLIDDLGGRGIARPEERGVGKDGVARVARPRLEDGVHCGRSSPYLRMQYRDVNVLM